MRGADWTKVEADKSVMGTKATRKRAPTRNPRYCRWDKTTER